VAIRTGLAAAERDLGAATVQVRRSAASALARAGTGVERAAGRVESGARAHLRGHEHALVASTARLVHRAPRRLTSAGRDLDRADAQLRAFDPARTLARGWSITRDGAGRVVRSAAELGAGDPLVTTLADGEVHSTVTEPDPAGGG
jgi:exodeoxyribonuclease VII large subunit